MNKFTILAAAAALSTLVPLVAQADTPSQSQREAAVIQALTSEGFGPGTPEFKAVMAAFRENGVPAPQQAGNGYQMYDIGS